MKIALVTARSLGNQWNELHHSVSLNLVSYIKWCGFEPLVLPSDSDTFPETFINQIKPDLLVLSGGESLGENLKRDQFEKSLLDYSFSFSLPVLGICRGMQVMANYFGATPEKIVGHAGTRHEVTGILQATVNSFHNFGFWEVPSEFDVLAKASDNSIEMIHHTALPWLGVMWHPEREPVASRSNVLGLLK